MKKTPEKLPLIDTHAHLTWPDYKKDIGDVLKRSWDAGLEAIVAIGSGDGLEGNKRAVEFANKHENVYATIGIHPHDAEKVSIEDALATLKGLADNEKVVAIGEIGLDYHYDFATPKAQKKMFSTLLDLTSELKLPISIHDREAHKDVLNIVRERKYEHLGGIFHCFSGDVKMAHEVVDLGFYISIPGIVTFKKAKELREVVKEIPIERLVLETDSPYLAPEPFRGKRNEPAYTTYIAEEIAEIKGLSVNDIARVTTINARRAYNLPGMIPVGKLAYPIRNSLYINLTNQCTLTCVFCPKRNGRYEVKGHNLKLAQEPNVEDILRAIDDFKDYDEVVFCGFGEPTLRLEQMKVIAKHMKEKAVRIRLNTDGLVNLVSQRDVLPELAGLIDSVSVSMNAPDPRTYSELCPSEYGEKAFYAMLSFLGKAKEFIPEVAASVVAAPGVDVDACKKLAKELGVPLRVRKYQELG